MKSKKINNLLNIKTKKFNKNNNSNNFYCNKNKIDGIIPIYKTVNNLNIPNDHIKLDGYSQKYITGNNFKNICDFYISNNKLISINNNILKPFYGCFIFIICGEENFFFNNIFNSIKEPFYIVTHNSDTSSPNECYKYLDNSKIIKWYCKNNDYSINHNKLELIPLGLGNTRDKNILNKIKELSVSKKTKVFI